MVLLTTLHINCIQYVQKGKEQFSSGFGQEFVSFNGNITHPPTKEGDLFMS